MPPSTRVSPGLTLLGSLAPSLLAFAVLVILTNNYAPFHISGRTWIALFFSLVPVYATGKIVARNIIWAKKCKKLNVQMPPFVKSTAYTLGLDVIYRYYKALSSEYLADPLMPGIPTSMRHAYGVNIFGDYVLVTNEPEYIKAILTTDFDSFEKGESFRKDTFSVLGTGVFNSDGEMWKFHRAMIRPFFSRQRVTDFDLFEDHINIAISKIKKRFAEGEPVDFQDVMSRFTLDTATEFLFGSCVNSLSAPLPYAWNSTKSRIADRDHPSDIFARAFGEAQFICARRLSLMDLWYLVEFFGDQTRKPMSIIYQYIDPILKEALARKASSTSSPHDSLTSSEETKPDTLLDHLVSEVNDFDMIRDGIVNIMIAGRDTTMATLTFALYCLSQHPHYFDMLRQEILSIVGPSKKPTQEDIKACKFLRAVINEILRLYPAVPFNIRRAKRDTTFPSRDGKPFFIPAGIDISYSIISMHRREDLWGPDAKTFDPNRFLDERVHKYLTPNPFIFLPFNAGPRICLGQQFAYNEVSYALIRLLQEFESIEIDAEAQPPDARPPAHWKDDPGIKGREKIWPKFYLTLYAYKGLWLRMKGKEAL